MGGPSVVDLFCGCGGLSMGFGRAGFSHLAAFDKWPSALKVHAANASGYPVEELDLGDVGTAVARIRALGAVPDAIVGGPPCQDFSSAGDRTEGDRADLTRKFAEIVIAVGPRSFVMENVERALLAEAHKDARRLLSEAGYGLTVVVLDASRCGAPQKRKRAFVIGVMGAPDGFLDTDLKAGLSVAPTTLREYLDAEGNEAERGLFTSEHYYRHPRSYARRGVFSLDEPTPTVRGVRRPMPKGYPGHTGDPVDFATADVQNLSSEMIAAMQTFPTGFVDVPGVSRHDIDQIIGNAVPPVLGRYVGERLAAYLAATPVASEIDIPSLAEAA
jgi:DNA (cytosine-5)-methyltransferase 1